MFPAKLGDPVFCFCACAPGICPPGNITTGAKKTLIENRPVARVGDLCSNCCFSCCPCPNAILSGDVRTLVENQPLAHNASAVFCGIVGGSPGKTFIGLGL